ncbi:PQQ-dependent sugar dehydrogenase [Alteromonadaceae bacterium M269]|nr:PQQ-dependent sugar dehydrogenase [Alteromonadaceae bacterium M269]
MKKLFAACSLGILGALVAPALAQQALNIQTTTITSDLSSPWAIELISDEQMLISERPGVLKRLTVGQGSEVIQGTPNVFYRGQGGLLDIALDPEFEQNQKIYLSYSSGDREENRLEVLSARLVGNRLEDSRVIFKASPSKDTPVHYAGRMLFLPDQTLLVTVGDGFDYREHAQKTDSLLGKIVRVMKDGKIPDDNPFAGESEVGVKTEMSIFSLGHRNHQALIYDEKRQLIFSNEHGPAGGDEINIIEPGKNYGWPVITNGKDYSGASITPFKTYEGMEQPFVDWTPSIAPSSMAVYYGNEFPQLNGNLLVTSLKSQELLNLTMVNNRVTKQENILPNLRERYRDIKVNSKGEILVLTDSGKLIKLSN